MPLTTLHARPDYRRAPIHLRLRFWLAERFWCWCASFAELGAECPEQANPLWRR